MSAIHHRADRPRSVDRNVISRRPASARSSVETYAGTRSYIAGQPRALAGQCHAAALPRMGFGLTLTVPRCAISGGARVSLAHIRAPARVPVIAGSRVVIDARRGVDPYDGVRRA